MLGADHVKTPNNIQGHISCRVVTTELTSKYKRTRNSYSMHVRGLPKFIYKIIFLSYKFYENGMSAKDRLQRRMKIAIIKKK